MNQATHNKIVSFIWGIADDVLRDLFRRGKYPDVILPMCVIRRMDAVLEPSKKNVLETKKMLDEARITEQRAALCDAAGQAFYNTSKFTLRDLKSRGSQQQLLADFEDYLNGFSPNVQDINAGWERLSIFLNLLTPKLPAPKEEDLAKGILEAIDMDSYRVEKKTAMKIALADEDAEIEPVPTDAVGHKSEPELDRLSNILKSFNEQFGTLFTDTDRVAKRIRDDIAPKVATDAAYRNAKENTPHTARMAHDQALAKVMQHLLKDDTLVYKQFVENESFKRFVGDMVYAITSQ